ncbi:FAD-dependent monooxygenase [Streptomyces sp. VRA16 Mangrove soil]|uniref:FAD-dependent monooxygenase n=1 Tax=Streptomyces sp. VRA16 Mangrove soil TaxID=2817434 RepID=UPI001A9E99B7|nr:FAD-dependent monooxygenase [Streptomyces sp. VRA16 Mangrove soil]MBO1337282.1 FAD-dependent monooxygenase [Streptomyces sp. VRA16 Mangrove soil]
MTSASTGPAQQARAVVIGGGIGGLTAALALHLRGWRVTVLEQAGELKPVGAGISLAPNAQRALDVVGLGDDIRSLAAWEGDGGLLTPRGRWLSRADPKLAAERFGDSLVLLHRATLIDLLAARLPAGVVRTGSDARLADAGDPADQDRPARVTTGDDAFEAELVVAADGIHSAVRRALFPGHPGAVYAGFTTWRLLVPPLERPFAQHESWGPGQLWGTHPFADGTLYAYAAALAPEGARAPGGDEKAELLHRFGDWHHPIPAILDAAEPARILRHDVHHIATPLPAFHHGRVALVGDAAHAMAPMLGQGGNQAVEDAVVLAHHAPADAPVDLAGYTRVRQPRTTAIARKAMTVSRLNLLRNRPAIALRNTAIRAVGLLGPTFLLRGMDGVADWRPPQREAYVRPGERV